MCPFQASASTISKAGEQSDVKVFRNAEGEKYVDLGKKKRAAVRSFKGQVFADIREFYGPDGGEKPGKKGISLTFEQWEALKRSVNTIDSLFAEQGKK
ncbi:RNA polymerase II transcriptional coactivator [Gyrodon lividus]|nr:RNA polymerase II transcriptional coactivator [Gyrodon lividus]